MLKRRSIAACAVLCFVAFPASAQEETEKPEDPQASVGLHAGTAGAGVHIGYPVSESIEIRAVGNYLQWDYEDESGGVNYKGDLNLESYGLAADWRPFDGGFRVGLGGFLNNNEVSASAQDDGGGISIGNNRYQAAVNADLTFEKFAPYAGIGYGGDLAPGLTFYLDLGVLYTGAPELSLSGNVMGAAPCDFSVNAGGSAAGAGCDANFLADLESEHRDARDDLEKVKFHPVLALGISYRF